MESEESSGEEKYHEPLNYSTVNKDVKNTSFSQITLPSSKHDAPINDKPMARMLLNDNKAGMEGLDKERINQIILEASKGSKFYENEQKKQKRIDEKIKEQQQHLSRITPEQIESAEREMDKLCEELEACRDLSRTIVHIDMDAFYAAVEMRDNSSLQNRPMAVGGLSMLSTSNYLARRYGVRAAMPGFIAKKLCPELVIIPSNFKKYIATSKQFQKIFAEYDPNVYAASLDEAYLDITQHLKKRQCFTDSQRTFPKPCCLERPLDDDKVLAMEERALNLNMVDVIDETILQQLSDGHDKHLIKSNVMINEKSEPIVPSEHAFDLEENQKEFPLQTEPTLEKTEMINKIELKESFPIPENNISICPICGKERETITFGYSDEETVREIRHRIEQYTHLTASAGIAPNTLLAKVCSDFNKPNGQYKVQSNKEDVLKFIKSLPIRKISGIGRVCEQMLKDLDIHVCHDFYLKRGLLHLLHSPISVQFFIRIALGIGSSHLEGGDSPRKSLSCERTFQSSSNLQELIDFCRELSKSIAEDAMEEDIAAKTLTVKMKTDKFEIRSRSLTLPHPTCDGDEIFSIAKKLLKAELQMEKSKPLTLRLLGIRLSSLVPRGQAIKQQTLTSLLTHKEESRHLAVPSTSTQGQQDEQVIWHCPMCHHKVVPETLQALNSHIDMCLNKDLIKSLSKTETSSLQESVKKRKSSSQHTESKKKKLTSRLIDTYFKSS